MSEICQFAINNRADYFDRLTSTIEMILRLYNGKIDEIDEKLVLLREDGKGVKEKMREAKIE